MSEKVKIWFSATELSMLGKLNVADLPTSSVGSTGRAQSKGWISREVPCMGGKKGMRTEYQPPADVLALIQPFLAKNPEFFKPKRGKVADAPEAPASAEPVIKAQSLSMYRVQEPGNPHGEFNEFILSGCLSACNVVHGEEFAKLSTAQQLGYAVDFYNLLVRMCHSQGVAIGDMKRLETKGLVEQLGAFVKLGWARKFPPPPIQVACFF